MKLLVYSAKDFEIPYLNKANNGKHSISYIKEVLTSETAMKAIGFDGICIFSGDTASNIVLEKLKSFGIKYIALRSVGFDNVNLFTANQLKIKVANVPAYSPNAIAEHAVGLLLALNRNLIESNHRVKRYNFELNGLVGFDLNQKTIGIIGTGNIGSVMTKIMHGFGCNILGHDLKEDSSLIEKYGMDYLPLEELCNQSDIISIHLPLNTDTQHLIDKDLIDNMKDGVFIINTARGAILNTEHIIDALDNGKIAALGIDVYEHEKELFFKDLSDKIPNDPMFLRLNAMPNVLITGHHAFLTDEALTNIANTTIFNIDCWSHQTKNENELFFKEKVST